MKLHLTEDEFNCVMQALERSCEVVAFKALINAAKNSIDNGAPDRHIDLQREPTDNPVGEKI